MDYFALQENSCAGVQYCGGVTLLQCASPGVETRVCCMGCTHVRHNPATIVPFAKIFLSSSVRSLCSPPYFFFRVSFELLFEVSGEGFLPVSRLLPLDTVLLALFPILFC